MDTIEEIIESKTSSELAALFNEAETFRGSGVLPEDTEIRKIAHQVFGESNVLQMDRICCEVYRRLAKKVIEASTSDVKTDETKKSPSSIFFDKSIDFDRNLEGGIPPIKKEAVKRLTPVLDWVSENLPTPQRLKVMFGRKNAIVLLFVDKSSEESIDVSDQKAYNDHIQRYSELIRINEDEGLDEEEIAEVQRIEEIINRYIEEMTPLNSVFTIIAAVGGFIELNFHNPEKLRQFNKAIAELFEVLDSDKYQ